MTHNHLAGGLLGFGMTLIVAAVWVEFGWTTGIAVAGLACFLSAAMIADGE